MDNPNPIPIEILFSISKVFRHHADDAEAQQYADQIESGEVPDFFSLYRKLTVLSPTDYYARILKNQLSHHFTQNNIVKFH